MQRHLRIGAIWAIACICLSSDAFAEKFKGYIWDISISDRALLVEGVPTQLLPDAKVERKHHDDITFADLRIGWEVEVDGKRGQRAFQVKKIKVRRKRFDKEDIEGFVEILEDGTIEVDGTPVVWPDPAQRPKLTPGMQVEGEGVLLDDGTVQVRKAKVIPAGFDEDEQAFMSLVAQEVDKMKAQLEPIDDPKLQAYVDSLGQSLVPAWVDRNEMNFNFSVIEDENLNAFALPDGTVVIYTGLLAALQNEAQFATVIGHEIAHATHRHGYRGYKNQSKMKWLQLGALAGGIVVGASTDNAWAGVLTGLGSSLALSAAVNGHGRKLEDDADRIGLEYMVDAGYDYMEAPEVWRVFNKYTKDQSAAANFFFSDHSTHRARISNLTREINANYRPELDHTTLKKNEGTYLQATSKLR